MTDISEAPAKAGASLQIVKKSTMAGCAASPAAGGDITAAKGTCSHKCLLPYSSQNGSSIPRPACCAAR